MASNLEPPAALWQPKLCEACRNGHLDQVKKLITNWKRYATPGQKFDVGTALHESSARGHFQIAEFLLKEGAEVDARDRDGRTPLHYVVSEACQRSLVSAFDPPWLQSLYTPLPKKQKAALHYACKGRSIEAVELLLNAGAHVDVQDLLKSTPLILAVNNNAFDIMKQFFGKNDSLRSAVNRADGTGKTALHYACKDRSTEAVELLLNAGACVDVYIQDHFQKTPLILAVENNAVDIVKLLLKNDSLISAVNRADVTDKTALHYACKYSSTEAVELLLNAGAHVDVQDHDQCTPLMLAVNNVTSDTLRILLKSMNNLASAVSRTDWKGQTALHFACIVRSTEAVELLLNAGAHVDVQDDCQRTPLMLAVNHGALSFGIMKLLLKNNSLGSAVNRTDVTGRTALHYACEGRSTEAVELLLNAGAHVDVQDQLKSTPLMLASHTGNNEVVKQLILRGADVNKIGKWRITALQWAAKFNHIECGILLVEAGANVHLKNEDGRSPIDLARPAFKEAVTQAISFQTKKAICVVGNALSGKSTLVASLKNEEAKFFQKARNYLFGIGGISQRTTGIEPVPLNSKRFGSVMFFDFAGQQEYHGPHELFLKSILSRGLSTVTVIVVVKATEEGPAIAHQLNRWLYPLSQASILSASNQVRIVVVASHIDKVKKRSDAKKKLKCAYEDIKQAFVGAPLQFVDLVCLNCCKPYSDGIDKLCQYLNDVPFPKYKTEHAGYSILWVISRIRSTIDDKVVAVADLSSWITRYGKDLPWNLPDADTVCKDLSSTGHFLYLPNSQDLAKGWLVLDLPYILHEVYGTIFSPFSQRRIANQFGLVAVTTLADLLPSWNSDLICGILIALEFAIRVDSTMCRELKGLSSGSEGGNGEEMYPQHLFFPALVSSQRSDVFKESYFVLRWLFRVNSQSYITPFILQSIIHCLTTKHVLFHVQGSLCGKYLCRVWYNGIFWQTSSGDIAVQVSDCSVLQVIATSGTSAEELFKYTTAVVGDISSTIYNLAPGMSGSSYIICPGEPQALLENPQAPSPLHMFPVDFILDSLKKNQTACLSLMDGDCPATRMGIPSLLSGFEPTKEDISGLLLQPNVKSTGSVESETVDTLPDTPIVKLETTPIAGRDTTQQLLDKYKDNFTSDLNSQSVLQPSKVDDIISSSVCFEVEALQTVPLEKDLRIIANNCGNNWKSLLTLVGVKNTKTQEFESNESTLSDACFQGLVFWLGGNADDSDPVNWSTLLTAMKEAGMAGDAREWKEKIVERCAASLDRPRDAGQSGNDEIPTPGQEEPSISSNVSKSATTED